MGAWGKEYYGNIAGSSLQCSCVEDGRYWWWLQANSAASAKWIVFTGSLWECLRVVGPVPGCVKSQCLLDRCSDIQVHLGAPGSKGNKPGRADDKPGSTWEHRQRAWESRREAWDHLIAPSANLGVLTTGLTAPTTRLGARRITVEQSWKNIIFFGNAAGEPGNHSYNLSFNEFQNSGIQFVFLSMYLCIYIATHLHTVYLDWLQAVLEKISRYAWEWRSSELRDTLWGHDRATFEMHLEVIIDFIWRYTWGPRSSEPRCTLSDRDRANMEMHLQVMIMRTWRL